ncbi:MAG TPA: Ig domain-containing protein [Terriglobia bacterium]|nr:Ig domain-containing protein [Terriglobia bacterium]
MKKLALALSILVLMGGCGHNSPSPVSLIRVTINPNSPPSVDQGQTLQFTASLAGDTSNAGVTWSATGAACAGKACGTFSNVTPTSATYTAPASVSASLTITVTANSVANTLQTATAIFYVLPPPSIVTTNLPSATPNYIYDFALVGTGGVQPLNWTLVSGTLPAGLSLNNAGTVYGTPTTGGTSTFTVKVTDSSGAPGGALSTQQTLSLTIVGVLTVPNALLPNGNVGIPYSTTLASTGGMPPFTWGIYSGSLPSGLVLQQSTGVISGTPTVQGTASFVVEAFDSSPIQQYYISSTFSITINPSGPLTIRTSSLLDGAVDTAYHGQLVATGGTPPLVWTVTAGGLPLGLALSPTTGAISGIPTGTPGTSSFTVEVSDTSSPQQTSTQQLSITINAAPAACSSTGNDSLLVGQYAFSLRGYNALPSTTNGGGFLAMVGSFTADGAGNITAGEADTNGVLGAQNGSLITSASSYSVGPDNRGCATFATPFGTFFTRFVLGAISAGVATQGRIMEFDNPGASAYIAAGQVLQQSSSAFLSPLTGSYALRTAGWDPSTSGRVACVGIVTGAKFKFSSLQEDCNDDGTVSNTTNTYTTTNTTLNTYSTADTNGRGTGNLLVAGNFSDLTFYWVSSMQVLMINSDPSPTFSGDWQQEEVPLGSSGFNQASFNSNVAAYYNGLVQSGAGGDVSIATETADGSSSVVTQLYRDVAGAWQTASTTCSYTVVLIGRVTLNGSGCGANPSIAYLNSLNTAFVLGTDSAIELGSFEPRTTGLTNASLAGTYFVGTSEVVNQAAQAEVGIVTLTSNGIVTSTSDTASTLSQTAGASSSDTYSLNPDGTFSTGSSGGTTVGMAISGSKFVIVNNPTLTFPTLLIGQQ